MEKPKLCIIKINNKSIKYIIGTKLLDSPKKKIETDKLHILNFIKEDYNKKY
jgi:hypothetical protein